MGLGPLALAIGAPMTNFEKVGVGQVFCGMRLLLLSGRMELGGKENSQHICTNRMSYPNQILFQTST